MPAYKGIDLRTASEALIKVEGGHYRALATLGIELRKGATATEAMTAVQKVAQGQAEAYGDTTVGAMSAASIALDEVVESIGVELVPVVKELAIVARDDLVPALQTGVDVMSDLGGTGVGLGDVLGELITHFNPLGDSVTRLTDQVEAQIRVEDNWASGTNVRADDIGSAYSTVGNKAETMGTKAVKASNNAKATFEGFADAAVSAAGKLIDNVYDPLILREDIWQSESDITKNKRILKKLDCHDSGAARRQEGAAGGQERQPRLPHGAGPDRRCHQGEISSLFHDLDIAIGKSTGSARQDLINLRALLKSLTVKVIYDHIDVGAPGAYRGTRVQQA